MPTLLFCAARALLAIAMLYQLAKWLFQEIIDCGFIFCKAVAIAADKATPIKFSMHAGGRYSHHYSLPELTLTK